MRKEKEKKEKREEEEKKKRPPKSDLKNEYSDYFQMRCFS